MPTSISDSPNISILDSKIICSLCSGNFVVDITPSVWIGSGFNNVQGASVRITNPVGVIITNYPTSGYDIVPPMSGSFSFPIPLIAANYQYGTYIVDVRLTDADGDTYIISKNVNICPPDPNNKNKKDGCLKANIKGDCKKGQAVVILNAVPTYRGVVSNQQTNEITVEYPTSSALSPLNTSLNNFSLVLFEGQYKITGYVCANYNSTDNIVFEIRYRINCEKIIKCIIDECCVYTRLNELYLKSNADCSPDEKLNTASTILDALFLLKTAQLAQDCGEDPSEVIADLEKLLGCSCTCNCNEGSPIANSSYEAQDWIYRGLLTQTGTDAPTQVVSTLNPVTITWARLASGQYEGTLAGNYPPLTRDNIFILSNRTSNIDLEVSRFTDSSILVRTNTDNQLDATSIQLSIL